MIQPRYLVGVTGRRNLSHIAAVRGRIALALQELKQLVAERGGMLEMYSSMAYGADTLAVQEARKLGIPVHLILPKLVAMDAKTGSVNRRAGFAADFWDGDPEQGGSFREQDWHDAWTEIQLAEQGHNGGSLRLTLGSQSTPDCYYDAGLQMLEAVDVLLSVWDGKGDRGLGGTGGVVKLAFQQKLPIIIIPCSRGAVKRRRLNHLAIGNESLRLIHSVDQFSQSYGSCPQGRAETADELLHRLEACSNKESQQFRNSLVRIIKAHAVATLVAATAALLPQTKDSAVAWKFFLGTLALLELCLVGWAFWRNYRLTLMHGTHDRWMQTRFAAELMRAMRDSCGLLDPLHPSIARPQPQWRRFAMTAGLLLNQGRQPQSWRSARDRYVKDRLRNPDIHHGQIKYFSTKHAEAVPHYRRALAWGTRLGWGALIFVLGALVIKCWALSNKLNVHLLPALPDPIAQTPHNPISWSFDIAFKFLPIALPLLSGMAIALRTALDSGRRSFRYNEVASRLSAAATTLESLETEASVRRTVTTTEEILLDELVEWHHAEQQNGGH